MSPKVSVIVPTLNVVTYIRQCLDSVTGQTLQNIEIICVDAGSTDGTREVLREYADRDERIRIIDSDKKSYGYQMNLGLDAASGEYIGIVESDDYMSVNAYETLAAVADREQAEIVKSDYADVRGGGNETQVTIKRLTRVRSRYGRVVDPSEEPWAFYVPMSNCIGIIRREYIEQYHMRFNETPGSSHQDMGFWWQTLCMAKRVYFTEDVFYHYRQDNPNSSMNDHKKMYCVRDEYKFMYEFIKRNPAIVLWCMPIYYHRMFGSYLFTYNQLVDYIKPLFLHEVFQADFIEARTRGWYSEERFSETEKRQIEQIVEAPELFLQSSLQQGEDQLEMLEDQLVNSRKALHECQKRLNAYAAAASYDTPEEETENGPKVSVIIPVYNTEPYLEECLNSIVSQTLKDIEIICVNDGSTDKSLKILKRFAKKDNRFSVYSQPNMGQSVARNLALSHASGKYIYFMDSDDLLQSDALEYLYDRAEADSLDILYFDATTFFENKEVEAAFSHTRWAYMRPAEFSGIYTGAEMLHLFHESRSYQVSPCLQFIRRGHLNENKIRFYEGIIFEDNLFNIRTIITAKRVSHRRLPFFSRRIRGGSTTVNTQSEFRHLYGYLVCYIEMTGLWIEYAHDPEAGREIKVELDAIANTIRKMYGKLDDDGREKLSQLTDVERTFLDTVMAPKKMAAANKAKTKAAEELKDSQKKVKKLKKQLKEQQETDAAKIKRLKKSLKKLRASRSYRIGRAITWLPRKVRGFFRCLKEHGVGYTARRVLVHLHLVKDDKKVSKKK